MLVVSVSADVHMTKKFGWLDNREFRNAAPHPKPIIPPYAFRVAGGTDAKASWAILLFGRDGQNCWGTQFQQSSFPKAEGAVGEEEFATCGLPTPPSYWRRVAGGPFGTAEDRKTVMLFTTRLDVRRLRVVISHGGRVRFRVQQKQFVPRRIGRRQAHRARLRRNFRYGVLVAPRLACIRRVMALDRQGRLLEETAVRNCHQ